MFDLVVRSGRIVTPEGVVMGDLAVSGETIAEIGQGLGPGKEEIDATGRIVFPGVVDAHVHLGVPSKEFFSVDGMQTGTRTAVFGGVTTVIDFTVQEPGEDLVASFERRRDAIAGEAHVDVALHVNVTSFSQAALDRVPALVERGAPSFKVFTAYGEAGMQLGDAEILRLADAVGRAGGLLMAHCENGDAAAFLREKAKAARETAVRFHEASRPDLVEAEAIHRVATLSRLAECPLYVVHLSTARGLEVIRRFRGEGWTIRAETCPQYLLLDRGLYEGEDGHLYVVHPPLRTAADRAALMAAVNEGEIDVLATDHAPFSREQKSAAGGDFTRTPGGMPGVETLFPLTFSRLVALGDGGLTPRSNASLLLLARVLAENPARLFGLLPAKGVLRRGADADFLVFDPNPIRRLRTADLHGAADWCPFEDFEVRGEIRSVYLRGKRVVEGGQLHGAPGDGRFVPGRIETEAPAEPVEPAEDEADD